MSLTSIWARLGTLVCVGFFSLIPGCNEFNDRLTPLPPDGDDLPIVHQVSGTFSHEDRPMELVIRDQELLSQVPLVDVPVDFRSQMLLVVTLGRRLSDKYAVRINRVWREGSVLRVDYQIDAPPPDAPVTVSSPFCIAVVPRCDLNVVGFSPTLPRRRPRLPDALMEQRDIPAGAGGGSASPQRRRAGAGNVSGGG